MILAGDFRSIRSRNHELDVVLDSVKTIDGRRAVRTIHASGVCSNNLIPPFIEGPCITVVHLDERAEGFVHRVAGEYSRISV